MKITALYLLAALLLVGGCVNPGNRAGTLPPTPAEVYASTGWQANTVTALAFDLREDGKFDYVWAEDVPQDLRHKLELRAIHLNKNWDGE